MTTPLTVDMVMREIRELLHDPAEKRFVVSKAPASQTPSAVDLSIYDKANKRHVDVHVEREDLAMSLAEFSRRFLIQKADLINQPVDD